jgi:hypothetical protein
MIETELVSETQVSWFFSTFLPEIGIIGPLQNTWWWTKMTPSNGTCKVSSSELLRMESKYVCVCVCVHANVFVCMLWLILLLQTGRHHFSSVILQHVVVGHLTS